MQTHIVKSFGAMQEILTCFEEEDMTQMQLICKFMYKVGVSRVQVRVKNGRKLYFSSPLFSQSLLIARPSGTYYMKDFYFL